MPESLEKAAKDSLKALQQLGGSEHDLMQVATAGLVWADVFGCVHSKFHEPFLIQLKLKR